MPFRFVILSDRRERRISISPREEEILRRFAPQNDSLGRGLNRNAIDLGFGLDLC